MPRKAYTPGSNGAASKFGQLIGEAFERAVIRFINDYIEREHPLYVIVEAEKGKKMVTLEMLGGSSRQLDTVIAPRTSDDPVALLETKWLKDARHHNDKGAWILQLREVKKRYASVRGAAAVLAGYWTSGVGVILMSEGGVKMVWVATDEEVYGTLQPHLDSFLGDKTFEMEAGEMRLSYPRPWDLANCAMHLYDDGTLDDLADTWLEFSRTVEGVRLSGKEMISKALDDLLSPLPDDPSIESFEIALQVSTGNVIYQEFNDYESAMQFIQEYVRDPEKILKQITPNSVLRPKQGKLLQD